MSNGGVPEYLIDRIVGVYVADVPGVRATIGAVLGDAYAAGVLAQDALVPAVGELIAQRRALDREIRVLANAIVQAQAMAAVVVPAPRDPSRSQAAWNALRADLATERELRTRLEAALFLGPAGPASV